MLDYLASAARSCIDAVAPSICPPLSLPLPRALRSTNRNCKPRAILPKKGIRATPNLARPQGAISSIRTTGSVYDTWLKITMARASFASFRCSSPAHRGSLLQADFFHNYDKSCLLWAAYKLQQTTFTNALLKQHIHRVSWRLLIANHTTKPLMLTEHVQNDKLPSEISGLCPTPL